MAWLLRGENISKTSLFVLAQLTNVTDGQMGTCSDGQTDRHRVPAIAALMHAALMHSIARQKLSLCYSIVYYYSGAQRYEQFLQVG